MATGAFGGAAFLSAPTAPATAGIGPIAIGAAAGYQAEAVYRDSLPNKSIDRHIDSVGPHIGRAIDRTISWVDSVKDRLL